MSIGLQILIEGSNRKVLGKELHSSLRTRGHGRHADGYLENYTAYVCNCPTENCEGTVRIAKAKDLDRKCKKCAMEHRERGQPLSWRLSTLNASESTLELAVLNPHLFIREEVADAFKSRGSEPYVQRRTLFKCPTLRCNNTVTIYANRGKENLDNCKCRSCANLAKRKRPYERTYNHAIKNTQRRSEERTKIINWLMSYEDFVSLCKIPNCHYCNKPLGRAAYAGDEGSDALLLDRKDSNKDYTLDNCVPCCPKCNFTKNDRVSYAEMVLVMKHRGFWVEKE